MLSSTKTKLAGAGWDKPTPAAPAERKRRTPVWWAIRCRGFIGRALRCYPIPEDGVASRKTPATCRDPFRTDPRLFSHGPSLARSAAGRPGADQDALADVRRHPDHRPRRGRQCRDVQPAELVHVAALA